MSIQTPTPDSTASAPTPRYGACAVVHCPSCGTYACDDAADAEQQAQWCRDLDHGPARAREV